MRCLVLLAVLLMPILAVAKEKPILFDSLPDAIKQAYPNYCDFQSYSPDAEELVQRYDLPTETYMGSEEVKKTTPMYMVLCYRAAYNEGHIAFILDEVEKTWQVLSVPTIDNDGRWLSRQVLSFADYDPKTMMLGSHHKHRGMGDCYSSETYQWDPYRQYFYVNSVFVKSECDGDPDSGNGVIEYNYKPKP